MPPFCQSSANLAAFSSANCRLSLLDAGGSILWMFDLTELRYINQPGDYTRLFDGASNKDFKTANLDAIGLTAAVMDGLIAGCVGGGGGGPVTFTDYEVVCVAENNNLYLVNTTTGTLQQFDGTVVAGLTPVACGDSATAADLNKICMADDVNGDGSLFTPYVNVFAKTYTAGTNTLVSTFVNSYTDESCQTVYVPNNPTVPSTVGNATVLEPRFQRLTGPATFTFPATAVAFGVTVVTVNNVANPPTIQDGVSTTQLPEAGFTHINSADNSLTNGLYGTLPTVTLAEAGDVVVVTWNEVQ